MTLVKIEGKSLEKLIDVVSKGIGTLYEPRSIRKKADAEAYKIEALAKAEAKHLLIEGEAKVELYERTKERVFLQEVNNQINIENIVEKSIEHLEDDISETPVDDDWRTRFFKKAQDVSNDEMQEIWAKVLAGEVSKPGTTSFRTLEVVSNISKLEAETFQIACSLTSGYDRIYKLSGKNAFDNFGLTYSQLMILRDAGLVHDNDSLQAVFKIVPGLKGSIIYLGDEQYIIQNKEKGAAVDYRFPQISFTNAGKEICKILKVENNKDYTNALLAEMKTQKYDLTVLNLSELFEQAEQNP